MTIMTLGHSTHTPEDFIRIIQAARLDGIIDVRSHRTSHWPWWHEAEASSWIQAAGKFYSAMPSLGGWDVRHLEPYGDWASERGVNLRAYARGYFPKQRIGVPREGEPGAAWTNQGLYDYAWFTAVAEFQSALEALESEYAGPRQPRVAIICSELLWWKCHRSMIADVLWSRGVRTFHVLPNPRGIRVPEHDASDRLRRYPAEVRQLWAEGGLPVVQTV